MDRIRSLVWVTVLCAAVTAGCGSAVREPAIVCSPNASPAEMLAVREVRRYLYLTTGQVLPVVQTDNTRSISGDAVVVGRKDRPVVASFGAEVSAIGNEEYRLKTIARDDGQIVLIAGGDDTGTLYGAYRFAELLGVRFYMHGDVVPETRKNLPLPAVDETGKPLFPVRGIQPFHDFPEGPDWWNLDDYKAVISQLPKLRMNFIGLHTYPEGGVGPEPAVWIGPTDELAPNGSPKASYPSRHFTTQSGTWGYRPKNTGDYAFGASNLFGHDAFGAEVMLGKTPWPADPQACNQVFTGFGNVLREAFRHAHTLGIRTCVGTETPLTIPTPVKDRLKAAGKDPADPAVLQNLYEGMFQRIASAYPIDYYWFWTPEGWTWEGANEAQVKATLDDLRYAIAAARQTNAPFTLATCGWVLGPAQDRALFDNVLPKDMPMSCINREVGKTPVDPGFARVTGRPKWAIPWLEDDPALTSPQLWVGRMRRDAFDALRYGCTGLMGIHWRTRILGPNVAALARAAWDQTGWSDGALEAVEPPCPEGNVGGKSADYPQNPIAETEDDPLYQSVRYDMSAYRFAVPNGQYTVTLKFCEPHYKEAGRRVFGVKLQGKTVIDRLDIFAKVGQNQALDYTYPDVEVTDGRLNIEYVYQVEFPCIAAIAIEGKDLTRRINCGGPAYEDYEADLPPCPTAPRGLPTADFFADWADSEFGPDAGPKAAAIFAKLDGQLPQPSTWIDGPGGIGPDARPWEEASKAYAFVDELAALRPLVQGPGRLERFDYWLNSFRYMKTIAQVNCTWARYNEAMKKAEAQTDPDARRQLARQTALPIRVELVRLLADLYRYLLPTVSTPGEMGTVANWEQHIFPKLLNEPGEALAKILGEPLPAEAIPGKTYSGPARVIVPTVRTGLAAGEPLRLKVIVLCERPPGDAAMFWRPMGRGTFAKVPLKHVNRGVYVVELAADVIAGSDLEYYVEAAFASKETVRFPPTAPVLNQTVVVTPRTE